MHHISFCLFNCKFLECIDYKFSFFLFFFFFLYITYDIWDGGLLKLYMTLCFRPLEGDLHKRGFSFSFPASLFLFPPSLFPAPIRAAKFYARKELGLEP